MPSWIRNKLNVSLPAFGFLILCVLIPDALVRADWNTEWQQVLAAAKKEGRVMAYTSSSYDSTLTRRNSVLFGTC